ncbi:MAG: ATP-binding protein [Planctomycetaceae bacterium]|nr:ATP-binding protein [Planctomycetaceae bacterium]
MRTPAGKKRTRFGLSTWFLAGVALIIALVALILTLRSSRRQGEIMVQSFISRGQALIWALEAGTRTWMGVQGERGLLQQLVEETAKQPDIDYIAVTDRSGRILAHSDPDRINATFPIDLPEGWDADEDTEKVKWRVRHIGDGAVFEIRSLFAPIREDHHAFTTYQQDGHRGRHMGMPMERGMGRGMGARVDRSDATDTSGDGGKSFVFVGLDNASIDQALAEDSRRNLNGALLVAALGLGGLASLFWADRHKRSRRLLMDAQALSQEVVTSLPSGLLTRDPDGVVGIVNDTALYMLGLGRAEVAGRLLDDIPALHWDDLINRLGQRRSLEVETVLHGTGGDRAVTVTLSRIDSEDGLFLGHLFILHDVEEVKKLREEVERGRRLTALGNLAAGVAHEIRNPLSSIKGLATFLAGRVPPGGPEEESARTLVSEVNRLNRVVSELLEFARPRDMKTAPVDVAEIIDGALRLASSDAEAKRIAVVRDYEDGIPPAPVNRERLTQALLNLFLNGIQAMDSGGTLRVGLRRRPDGDGIAIVVADTGKGMSEEQLAAVFTPYYTTRPGGTGLGLAIVHQIVEGHNGGISVKSTPGKGSEFTVTLPL